MGNIPNCGPHFCGLVRETDSQNLPDSYERLATPIGTKIMSRLFFATELGSGEARLAIFTTVKNEFLHIFTRFQGTSIRTAQSSVLFLHLLSLPFFGTGNEARHEAVGTGNEARHEAG